MGAAGIRKRAALEAFPQRVGMGMDTGAIARGSKRDGRDEAHFDGRADNGKQEDVLQGSLKVKRDTTIPIQVRNNLFHNILVPFLCLLPFLCRFIRFRAVLIRREKFGTGVTARILKKPEPVHKVKIRPKWRKGMYRAANERSKDRVMPKPGKP